MKSILLLLTLSSALCYGQVMINGKLYTGAGYGGGSQTILGYPTLNKVDTPLADRNPNDFYIPDVKISTGFEPKVLSIEEKLLLYAEECYNDSTAQSIHGNSRGWSNDIHVLYCTSKDFPDHWKYIHRKPTFEGFIEWLKKQI